jgi:hypothetical protein
MNRDHVLEQVKKMYKIEPGHPLFVGDLQKTITTLWDRLSPAVQDDYARAAKEWSSDTPPKHIQLR